MYTYRIIMLNTHDPSFLRC